MAACSLYATGLEELRTAPLPMPEAGFGAHPTRNATEAGPTGEASQPGQVAVMMLGL